MKGPTATLEGLGYDSDGNNAALLAAHDARRLAEGDYTRVSGEMTCLVCGMAYRLHPPVQGALWLTRGCPDHLLKL